MVDALIIRMIVVVFLTMLTGTSAISSTVRWLSTIHSTTTIRHSALPDTDVSEPTTINYGMNRTTFVSQTDSDVSGTYLTAGTVIGIAVASFAFGLLLASLFAAMYIYRRGLDDRKPRINEVSSTESQRHSNIYETAIRPHSPGAAAVTSGDHTQPTEPLYLDPVL